MWPHPVILGISTSGACVVQKAYKINFSDEMVFFVTFSLDIRFLSTGPSIFAASQVGSRILEIPNLKVKWIGRCGRRDRVLYVHCGSDRTVAPHRKTAKPIHQSRNKP